MNKIVRMDRSALQVCKQVSAKEKESGRSNQAESKGERERDLPENITSRSITSSKFLTIVLLRRDHLVRI